MQIKQPGKLFAIFNLFGINTKHYFFRVSTEKEGTIATIGLFGAVLNHSNNSNTYRNNTNFI